MKKNLICWLLLIMALLGLVMFIGGGNAKI